MLHSKSLRYAILPGILLVLFISPSLASGVPLIPEDNVTIRCTTFFDTITIWYMPGDVSVNSHINLISENSVEQLTLVIPARSENFDNDDITISFFTYGREVKIEHIESELLYENYYLHKFRLLFNPPFTESEITIKYDTTVTEWDDVDMMYLAMPVWSPKIILENYGIVTVTGPSEYGFRLLSAGTTIGDIDPEYSDYFRTLSFTLEASHLVDFQYTYFWISVYYTPASPPLRILWEQYQNIESMLQQINQMIQQNEETIRLGERNILLGTVGIITAFVIGIIGIHISTKRASQKRKRKTQGGKLKKRLGNSKSERLILIGILVALMGAAFFIFGELLALKYPSSIGHKLVPLYGQLIIIISSPILILASICFVVENNYERWRRISKFVLDISKSVGYLSLIFTVYYACLFLISILDDITRFGSAVGVTFGFVISILLIKFSSHSYVEKITT